MTSATPPVLALPEASDALSSRLAEGLERVEALIVERTRNEDDFITEANLHLARAGGKRFRPVLTMLVAELGEDVGAAVSLREGASGDLEEIKQYVKDRVAAYKYPRTIWVLDELPKGPTGKILKREIHAPTS